MLFFFNICASREVLKYCRFKSYVFKIYNFIHLHLHRVILLLLLVGNVLFIYMPIFSPRVTSG